jgi:hypothetical protein
METAAGSTFGVESGELIDFTSDDHMKLWSAHELHMASTNINLHSQNDIEIFAESAFVAANETMVLSTQEFLSATAGDILVDTVGDASVTAVNEAKLEAGSASVSAVGSASVTASNVGVIADDSMDIYGGDMLIGSQDFNISSISNMSIMSGGKTTILTDFLTAGSPRGDRNSSADEYGSNVDAPMVINTHDQTIRAGGHVEVQSSEKLAIFTQGFEIDADRFHSIVTQDIEVLSGKSLMLQAPDEITGFGHSTSLLNTNTKITTVENIEVHTESLILDTLEDSLSIAMTEDMSVGVDSMYVSATGNLNVRSSQDMDVVVNHDAHISATRHITTFAEDGTDIITGNLLLQTDYTDLKAKAAQVAGTEALTMATNDAAFTMQRLGDMHVTELKLHFTYAFDEYENLLPRMSGVIEIALLTPGEVIQADCAPDDNTCRKTNTAPVPRLHTGTHGQIDLQDADGDWHGVWANTYTSGQDDSLVGFRRDLVPVDVIGLRITSDPWMNPSFYDWVGVIVHFKQQYVGALTMDAASTLYATAGDKIELGSGAMHVGAEDTLTVWNGGEAAMSAMAIDVKAAQTIHAVAGSLTMQNTGMDVQTSDLLSVNSKQTVATIGSTADLAVLDTAEFGARALSVDVEESIVAGADGMRVSVATDLDVFSAGSTDIQSLTASIDVGNRLRAAARTMDVFVEDETRLFGDEILLGALTNMDVVTHNIGIEATGVVSVPSAQAVDLAIESAEIEVLRSASVLAGDAAMALRGSAVLEAGGHLSAAAGQTMQATSDSMLLESANGVGIAGGDVSLATSRDIAVMAGGALELSAAGAAGMIMGDLTIVAPSANTSVTGSVGMAVGGAGLGTFAGSAVVMADDLSVDVADAIDIVAQAVEISSVDRASFSVAGASIELSEEREDGLKFQPFAWRATSSFDQWRNVLPTPVAYVEELLLRAPSAALQPRATVLSAGKVFLAINDVEVWSTGLAQGEFMLDALRVRLASTTVSSIALSGVGARFVDCGELVIYLGVLDPVSQGAVRVAAAATVELLAPTAARLAGNTVLVSAAETVELSAQDAVDVGADTLDVIANELDLRTVDGSASIAAAAGATVFAGGELVAQMASSTVAATGDVALSSGETLTAVAVEAAVEVAETLRIGGDEIRLASAGGLSTYAGSSIGAYSQDLTLTAGEALSVFAGEATTLTVGAAHVEAVDELVLDTAQLSLVTQGATSLASTDSASVSARSLAVAAADSIVLSSMSTGALDVADDLMLTAGGSFVASAHTATSATVGGTVSLLSADAVTAHATTSLTLDAVGDLDLAAHGTASMQASDALLSVSDAVEIAAGGDLSVQLGGGSSSLDSSGAGSISFGKDLSVAAGADLELLSEADLVLTSATSVDIAGAESVTLHTPVATLELSGGATDVAYSSVMWRAPSRFTTFSQVLSTPVRAQELTVSAASPASIGCKAMPKGGGTTSIWLLPDAPGAAWERVWSTTEETLLTSSGLSFGFTERTVASVRFDASNEGSHWDGCGELLLSLGAAGGGRVSLRTDSAVDIVAGEAVTLASHAVTVESLTTVELLSGGALQLSAPVVEMQASDAMHVQASATKLEVIDDASIIAGAEFAATAETASLSALGDIEILAADGGLAATAERAEVGLASQLQASIGGLMELVAGDSMMLQAKELALGSSEELELSADRVDAVADTEAKLLAGGDVELLAAQAEVQAETAEVLTSRARLAAKEVTFAGGRSTNVRAAGGSGVRLSSRPAPAVATAEFDVPDSAAEDPETMMAELAELLGVPVSRLRVEAVEGEDDSGR